MIPLVMSHHGNLVRRPQNVCFFCHCHLPRLLTFIRQRLRLLPSSSDWVVDPPAPVLVCCVVFVQGGGTRPSIKYIDPSYMIRSCPANAADAVMCLILAHNAVHGAMAGFTGFTSAAVNYRTVLLPVTLVAASSPSTMNPEGRTWQRVVSMTRQHSVLL